MPDFGEVWVRTVAAVRSPAGWALAFVVVVACGGCTSDASDDTRTPDPDGTSYVAMGDSYTAAVGVPEVVDASCSRSSANYPALVAEKLEVELTDVSCSGASTTSLTEAQETTAGVVPAQFSALDANTDYVTLGIGGNDEDLFSTLITTCLALRASDPDSTPCRDAMNAGGTDASRDSIELIQDRVTSALVGIRDRAPDATIVMVGYPQLVPAEGECDLLPLTPGDYDYLRGVIADLGAATEAAAAEANVAYVDVLAASEGHDICAGKDAWVSGIGGSTDRAAPLHPFAEEQQAVADLVVEALED